MARDSQRQKVYDAERAAFPDIFDDARLSVADVQALVEKVWHAKYVQRRWHNARIYSPPAVNDGRGTLIARGGLDGLDIPRWARNRTVVLHETAHALTQGTGVAWHGWQFCECYLYLVRLYMGRAEEEKLKREFKARKVKFREPRKRQMSPEAREAARQRMIAMHAARAA